MQHCTLHRPSIDDRRSLCDVPRHFVYVCVCVCCVGLRLLYIKHRLHWLFRFQISKNRLRSNSMVKRLEFHFVYDLRRRNFLPWRLQLSNFLVPAKRVPVCHCPTDTRCMRVKIARKIIWNNCPFLVIYVNFWRISLYAHRSDASETLEMSNVHVVLVCFRY